jgi:membrane-associated phospholipid phosphatase
MKTKETLIKSALLALYFIICIGIEPLYRKGLYNESLPVISQIRIDLDDLRYSFFRVITEFGTYQIYVPILCVILIWFPLNKSYSFLRVFVVSSFMNSFMKLIYADPRPFWDDTTLMKVCEGGFGNPSGHAMGSAAVYLSLANILTDYDYFKQNILMKVLIYISSSIFILSICVSRVVLAAHSINQILYGALLGVGIYYLYYHILEDHKMKGKEFFAQFRDMKKICIHSCLFFAFLSVAIIMYLTIDYNNSNYESILNNTCPNLLPYKKFQHSEFNYCMGLLSLIGCYYSIIFLANRIEKENIGNEDDINDWHLGSNISQLYRILLTFAWSIVPYVLMYAIPDDSDFWIIFIFKRGFSLALLNFCVFGLNVYISTKLKISNPLIHKIPNTEFKNVIMPGEEEFYDV